MTEQVFPTTSGLAARVADELCALLEQKPNALVCLAAGHSSLPVFEALTARKEQGADFSSMRFVAMDEWQAMNENDAESCGDFLRKYFLDPMGIGPERRRLFDGRAADPAAECEAVEAYIKACGGIDYILLGAGMNGHLALNEPGCDPDGGAHVTALSEVTMNVGQKYFSQSTALTGGLTLGIRSIKAAKDIVLAVHGAHKKEVVQRLRTEAPTADFPATLLKSCENARLYLDDAANDIVKELSL